MRLVTVLRRGAKAVAPTIVIVLVAMGGGFALANHDPNSIHACANSATGALRMVGSAADCRPGETAAQWNVQGPQGEPGAAGVSGYEIVSHRGPAGIESLRGRDVRCPVGKVVTGGGYEVANAPELRITGSAPFADGEESMWRVFYANESTDMPIFTAYAVCVKSDIATS